MDFYCGFELKKKYFLFSVIVWQQSLKGIFILMVADEKEEQFVYPKQAFRKVYS